MNREWMRDRLEAFRGLCDQYKAADRAAPNEWSADHERITGLLTREMPTVRKILGLLDPELPPEIGQPAAYGGMSDSLRAVQQGLGILDDMDLWAANLAPESPSLLADQFHPDVWRAASALWDTGQYRVAVQQACVSLSAHIAAKAGSRLTERALVAEVFSPKMPVTGAVRLHLPGDKASTTWKSRQDGLHLIAQGAFAGIRNVATHTDDEWSEPVALEHLAVLSVVARWADMTEIVTA